MTSVDGTAAPRPGSASARALRPDGRAAPRRARRRRRLTGASASPTPEALRILDCDACRPRRPPARRGAAASPTSTAATGGPTPTRGTASPAAAGHREKLLVAPNGAGRPGHRPLRAVPTGDGTVERVMLGLRDAEARQRAERDQATVLSRPWRTSCGPPLTSVTGFTSSLLRRWDRFTDEQKRLMIETIEADATPPDPPHHRAARHLAARLRQPQPAAGARRPHALLTTHVVALRARSLVRQPSSCGWGSARERRDCREMWADTDRLEQIFFNLIENGLLHGAGKVTVTLDRGGALGDAPESVVVEIDDEGDGIPPSDREKIFGRFWHGPSNASTGLGPLRRPGSRRGPWRLGARHRQRRGRRALRRDPARPACPRSSAADPPLSGWPGEPVRRRP